MGDQTNPTIAQAIAQALSDLQEPIPTKELIEKVLTIRPSSAKNPAGSIRNHLRWQENGKSIVYLDRKTLVPLRTAMRGVRFRIPLSRQDHLSTGQGEHRHSQPDELSCQRKL